MCEETENIALDSPLYSNGKLTFLKFLNFPGVFLRANKIRKIDEVDLSLLKLTPCKTSTLFRKLSISR